MSQRKKSLKEEFARFFEEPTRDRLRDLLRDHTGEKNEYDFKAEWPERSALARHVLAIANHGGGCIVVGVDDTSGGLEAVGLKEPMDAAELPYVCATDGKEIRKAAIYVRRGTNSVEASYEELQQLLNRRIETDYSSSRRLGLEEHLRELKSLYAQIPESFSFPINELLKAAGRMSTKNPEYPEESFAAFVRGLIDEKKKTIRGIARHDRQQRD